MSTVRVAIAGLGNCANSLIQGVEYYKDADADLNVPGLMHVQLGDYHVGDVEFVAAFDVDASALHIGLLGRDAQRQLGVLLVEGVQPDVGVGDGSVPGTRGRR